MLFFWIVIVFATRGILEIFIGVRRDMHPTRRSLALFPGLGLDVILKGSTSN